AIILSVQRQINGHNITNDLLQVIQTGSLADQKSEISMA
ncbi:MAG: hypothetical protein ACI8R8_003469, partial [Paraglaciecola sp.]